MAAKKKSPAQDLPSQSDPRAPLDGALLLARSQGLLAELEADLLARARGSKAIRAALAARHESERAQKRTADSLEVWERAFVTQVAASWLLSCVFVRTLEDRGLLGHARIAGPGATDSQRLFFEMAPSLTERDYLLAVFRELSHLPAAKDLFDPHKNPVWLLGPSSAVAKKLLELFRAPNTEAPGLRFGQEDTRFLGDLYQDLSADVRERFALLQTPHFVEKYILDRTLERSIARFGLDETTLIDPTCGSGHFLLGAFERLLDHRLRKEPGLDVREAARRALDAVYGADINPYAVAIARFRLTLSFLEKAGYRTLSDSPELPLHLVVGDSLLHNPLAQVNLGEMPGQSVATWVGEEYALENEAAARDVLHRKYTAVVGNPPYITVKDAVLRDEYRKLYSTAFRNYSLGVPFTERFFHLAKEGAFVGMITANSFMKREFGKKLVEDFLPKVNLDGIVNTSGAYIPGHGTPTVLLFASNERPVASDALALLAKRGEPSTPEDPEEGLVWRSIADHGGEVGFENDYISVAQISRTTLAKHPWSLGGGGAAELKELLESRATQTLGDVVQLPIGRAARVGMDDVYMLPRHVSQRIGGSAWRQLLIGEAVRDWSVGMIDDMIFPYDAKRALEPFDENAPELIPILRYLWAFRSALKQRATFQGTIADSGMRWYEYMQYTASANRTPLSITFAFVATHNHFVLDRGGKVFNRSAPIIKLKEGATEEDHLALLAYLNSSTACFWMKQVFQAKHSAEHSTHPEPERDRFEFAGTQMGQLPIPPDLTKSKRLRTLAAALNKLAEQRAGIVSEFPIEHSRSLRDALDVNWCRSDQLRERMISVQEEIDWEVLRLFGLSTGLDGLDPDIVPDTSCPRGDRPFERLRPRLSFVRRRDHLVPLVEAEIPPRSPLDERLNGLWKSRVDAIRSSADIGTIESALFKRQWRDTDDNIDEPTYRFRQEQAKGVDWLAGTLESSLQYRSSVARAKEFPVGTDVPSITHQVAQLLGYAEPLLASSAVVLEAAVPFLAAYRHTEAGLEKRAQWERVWDLQRAEDRGEKVPPFDPAPKYDQKDYRDANAWRLRGKLDVPKERFISYPGCESDQDKEPVYGWAGWNHLQQAQALASLYQNRKTEEGWGSDRLAPMLAGLLELIPWVKQWHNEPSEEFGGLRLGDYFETFLDGECHALGLTRERLRAWRPAERRGRIVKTNEDADDFELVAKKPPRRKQTKADGERSMVELPVWVSAVVSQAGVGAAALGPASNLLAYINLWAAAGESKPPVPERTFLAVRRMLEGAKNDTHAPSIAALAGSGATRTSRKPARASKDRIDEGIDSCVALLEGLRAGKLTEAQADDLRLALEELRSQANAAGYADGNVSADESP